MLLQDPRVNPSIKNKDGKTPLNVAIDMGDIEEIVQQNTQVDVPMALDADRKDDSRINNGKRKASPTPVVLPVAKRRL